MAVGDAAVCPGALVGVRVGALDDRVAVGAEACSGALVDCTVSEGRGVEVDRGKVAVGGADVGDGVREGCVVTVGMNGGLGSHHHFARVRRDRDQLAISGGKQRLGDLDAAGLARGSSLRY